MRKLISGSLMFALLTASPAVAAELLEVNPVVSGGSVSVEVTADIPMTYTFYKVPGQARAVVDIADADPEKVEPLIVVNKGAVASISVDKAQIADMTVSRLVFNLVKENDINVQQSVDRKKLTVTFGSETAVQAPVAIQKPAPEPPAVPVVAPSKPAAPPTSAKDEDPLGLDEPKAGPAPVKPAAPVKVESKAISKVEAKVEEDPLGLDEPQKIVMVEPASASTLKPVVPASTSSANVPAAVVKGIVVGASFIEIQTNGNVDSIKHMKLVKPDRLAVDIPGTSTVSVKSINVNKFGVSKMRIGTTPGMVRIVLDATKSPFPSYTVTSGDNGVKINFK